MPAGDVSFESRGIIDMDLGGASVGAYAGGNDKDSNSKIYMIHVVWWMMSSIVM